MNVLFWLVLIIVLIAIFGGAFFAAAWWLLWYALVGLVVGGIARLLVTGTYGLGMGATILSGVGGAVIGGWIAHWLDAGSVIELLISFIVAAIFIAMAAAGSRSDDQI
jgi:uncharacterized membrane protein YeaQ/YmgE (transglycosylase-associated protein family)